MRVLFRHRPSPAMVVALVALFVALGGVGYAATALPRNSVGAAQLKSGAVTPPKVAKAAIALFKGQQGPPGVQGPVGPQGSPGATGVPGSRGPSNGYFVSGDIGPHVLQLPAGSYLVYASAYVVATAGATVACTLSAGSASDSAGEFGSASLALSVAVNLATAGAASVSCSGGLGYRANVTAIAVATLG